MYIYIYIYEIYIYVKEVLVKKRFHLTCKKILRKPGKL